MYEYEPTLYDYIFVVGLAIIVPALQDFYHRLGQKTSRA
jgi:hypothetical protein